MLKKYEINSISKINTMKSFMLICTFFMYLALSFMLSALLKRGFFIDFSDCGFTGSIFSNNFIFLNSLIIGLFFVFLVCYFYYNKNIIFDFILSLYVFVVGFYIYLIDIYFTIKNNFKDSYREVCPDGPFYILFKDASIKYNNEDYKLAIKHYCELKNFDPLHLDIKIQEEIISKANSMRYIKEQVYFQIDLIRDSIIQEASLLNKLQGILMHPVIVDICVYGVMCLCMAGCTALLYLFCNKCITQLSNEDEVMTRLSQNRTATENLQGSLAEHMSSVDQKVEGININFSQQLIEMQGNLNKTVLDLGAIVNQNTMTSKVLDQSIEEVAKRVDFVEDIIYEIFFPLLKTLVVQKNMISSQGAKVLERIMSCEQTYILSDEDISQLLELTINLFF